MKLSVKPGKIFAFLSLLGLSSWGFAAAPEGRFGQNCFPQVERAAQNLRHSILNLAQTASRYERLGQTEIAAQNAARQVGAFQYQLYKSCAVQAVLLGRDRIRDRLDRVRQAFRGSSVLLKQASAFNAFKDMVTDWETVRDLVSDLDGPAHSCFQQVAQSVSTLGSALQKLASTASRYENRGQTEFTAMIANRTVLEVEALLRRTCNKQEVLQARDEVRDKLDAVRTAFRNSLVLSKQADAFQAFKNVVTTWEAFRDLVSNL